MSERDGGKPVPRGYSRRAERKSPATESRVAAAPRPRGSGARQREIWDVALRAEQDMEAEGQQASRTVLLAGA